MSTRVTAGMVAVLLLVNVLGSLLLSAVRPERAYAVFVADDVAAVAGIAAAAALTYGVVTNTTWANQTGVTDRSTAALYSELSMTGAMGEVGVTSAATVAYLMAARAGMVAQGTWTNFCTAANSAVAYGGYLWSSLTGGLYGNLAFKSLDTAPTGVSYPTVTSTGIGAWYGSLTIYPSTASAHQLAVARWLMAACSDPHGSPVRAVANGTSEGFYNYQGGLNYYHSPTRGDEMEINFSTVTADTIYADGMNIQGVPSGGAVGAIDYPTAKVYTDNPDVLPISPALTAANVGTIDANVGAGAIAIPTPADPVPWVPPVWLPAAPDITGIGNDLRGLASEVAGLFGETWAWLAAPFTGLLTGLAAITDWLSGITGWLQATLAQVFSPSNTQLHLEFEPRWNDLKTKLGEVWPFALVPFVSLLAGTLAGGAAGGQMLDTTWTLDFFGAHVVIHLADWLNPMQGFRWFWTALVWLWLTVALYRLFVPIVMV